MASFLQSEAGKVCCMWYLALAFGATATARKTCRSHHTFSTMCECSYGFHLVGTPIQCKKHHIVLIFVLYFGQLGFVDKLVDSDPIF